MPNVPQTPNEHSPHYYFTECLLLIVQIELHFLNYIHNTWGRLDCQSTQAPMQIIIAERHFRKTGGCQWGMVRKRIDIQSQLLQPVDPTQDSRVDSQVISLKKTKLTGHSDVPGTSALQGFACSSHSKIKFYNGRHLQPHVVSVKTYCSHLSYGRSFRYSLPLGWGLGQCQP